MENTLYTITYSNYFKVDVSNLQWYRQIELNQVFNLL